MNHILASAALVLLVSCGISDARPEAPAQVKSSSKATASLARQVSLSASRQSSKSAATAFQPLPRSVEYYDGEFRRTLWLSEELVVDMGVESADAALQEEAPESVGTAQELRGARTFRVRRGRADVVAAQVAQRGHRLSPALHVASTDAAPFVSLPGGVIVTVPREWSREMVDAWASGWGRSIEKVVQPQLGLYLVATGPGLESLELANRMHESGEILAATPNILHFASTR